MTTALILAGHGSHISAHTGGLVWRQVDQLRTLGIADEITACFWKEMPSFARVLDTVSADDITVVPLFTANGYFTQTVLPAEMGLTGKYTQRARQIIRCTSPLNEHPYLAQIVRKRVEDTLAAYALPPEATAVAVIGHSTRRNRDSRKATEAQAQTLRDTALVMQVEAVFLDDSPAINDIYTLTSAPNLIAVPYFLAAGSHTTLDVPRALSLEVGVSQGMVQGRRVFYTPPVGVEDHLLNVILALAQEAGMQVNTAQPGNAWRGFPTVGREALLAAVAEAAVLRFGELSLSLEKVHVWGDDAATERINTPAELRDYVRENPFRSLATAKNLPKGWYVQIDTPDQLHAVVETVYPGAVAAGTLSIRSFDATVERQTGMYRALKGMPNHLQAGVVTQVCAACVCQPLWFTDAQTDLLPCPEPCNHFLSAALEKYSQ
jgi:sirohydrochlorin cobaltochelatase